MHRRPQFEPLARLAAAGCGLFGSWVLRGRNYHARCSRLGLSSRVGDFVLPGAAAAAMPPVRSWGGCAAWDWAGCVACVSRGRFCPAGCCCGGFAAGTLLAWLCRLGLGRVLGLCLALVRLSGRVLLRRLRRLDALGLAVPLGIGPGTWPVSRVSAFIRSDAAAAAMPPVRSWGGCALIIWGSIVRHTPICCGCMGHCRPLFPL